ncbi:hypothetical protein [Luteimonas sp. 3794]|uniref:hypothetical protein n=1 Tax=Luteimonas sp. 3794 TaxID=2817730 RepID=UPI002859EE5A|nr:hypothetical protein [Luteimonas sp. 3794]MDR6992529.1 hypothetical protein [Luteimonas sp. 3794]
MDLIKYLEGAAVEVDVVWRSGNARELPGAGFNRAELTFAGNAALAQLLDARPTMICMIVAPDGGDTEEAEESPDHDAPAEEDADEASGPHVEG